MNIIKVPISEVTLWDKNPRNIRPDDFKRLKKQIEELGVYKPLIACKENGGYTVLGGNMRLRALKDMGIKEVDISIIEPKSEAEKIKYALSDNDRVGEYMEDELAELIYPFKDEIDLSDYKVDLGEPASLEDLISDYGPDDEEMSEGHIDKNLKDIKILNLYAGIGGNRRLWGDLDITSVEMNPKIAKAYQDFFPNDKMIIEDAHKYLEKHIDEYDFIWSSPPCPTHSRLRKNFGNQKPVYPDMKLYEEVLFLEGYFGGNWIVENVKSWYDPLIEPRELGRHYYWTNFTIPNNNVFEIIEIGSIDKWRDMDIKKHARKFGYNDISKIPNKSDYPIEKIFRNMVHPKIGEYILNCAYKETVQHGTS